MSQRSKYEFYQQASLSQKLSASDEDFIELAGTDTRTSLKIQRLKTLMDTGLIDKNNPALVVFLKLLNGDRKAYFATSERVNEVTKMGLMMPKGEDIITEF